MAPEAEAPPTVMLAGQVIAGGCVSTTVMLNVQLSPLAAVQVTVVMPTGKKEPETGEAVTVPQSPLMVGAG